MIAAHIHPGAAAVNGGLLVNLNVSAGAPDRPEQRRRQLSITVPITQVDATNITAAPANFYFNVHTPLNTGGGAARGQMARQ